MVTALVAVNAFGDVIEPGTGRILAGPRLTDGDTGSQRYPPGNIQEIQVRSWTRHGYCDLPAVNLYKTFMNTLRIIYKLNIRVHEDVLC